MKFKVGDLCVIVATPGCSFCQPYHGMQCTVGKLIVQPETPEWVRCCTLQPFTEPVYGVDCANGQRLAIEESQLRRRRPPSWDKWIFDTRDVQDEAPSNFDIVNKALLRLGAP